MKIIFHSTAIFILLLIPYISFSCGCDGIPFERTSEWADEIFQGELISVKTICDNRLYSFFLKEDIPCSWIATFKVSKKWKGNSNMYMKIHQIGTSCDAEFDSIGQEHLIYARYSLLFPWDSTNTDIKLTTNMCMRSGSISKYQILEEDLQELNVKYGTGIIVYNYRLYSRLLLLFGLLIVFFCFWKRSKIKRQQITIQPS